MQDDAHLPVAVSAAEHDAVAATLSHVLGGGLTVHLGATRPAPLRAVGPNAARAAGAAALWVRRERERSLGVGQRTHTSSLSWLHAV